MPRLDKAEFRLIDRGWDAELDRAVRDDSSAFCVVSPFIRRRAVERLFAHKRPRSLRVLTRFNLADFACGVSEIAALRRLLSGGAQVRGIKNLHAKMYLFGSRRAIVTSANLTEAALLRNHELGFVANDGNIVKKCQQYFESLWAKAGSDLTLRRLNDWDRKLTSQVVIRTAEIAGLLEDYGVDIGLPADSSKDVPAVDIDQAFVKFLGEGDNRVALSFPVAHEIKRAGCHWAVAYPASKRPTSVRDGATIFIGRLTSDPNDTRVFGRALGRSYVAGRDDATPDDIAMRPWKAKWPRYVRVHRTEFVAGTMANGVSLNELMHALGSDAFTTTMRNAAKGTGNTDPRRAYRQQAAVQLSPKGIAWLGARLETAFAKHGKLGASEIKRLGFDWPDAP